MERRDALDCAARYGRELQPGSNWTGAGTGVETPTHEELERLDRKRKKSTSNRGCKSPIDEDAWIAKMKDGRTHLDHKAEHAVDLDSGVVTE